MLKCHVDDLSFEYVLCKKQYFKYSDMHHNIVHKPVNYFLIHVQMDPST